jgi:hypothetical protein
MADAIPIKVDQAEGIVRQFADADILLADGVNRRSTSGNLVIGSTLDTIEATGSVTVAGVTSATNTITINGTVLTAVSGSRTSGSDDFSISSGTTAGIAADIVAAINDGANSFTGIVTASLNGSIVELTAVPTGSSGNSITLATSDAVNFTLSGATLSGGSEEELQLGSSTSVVAVQGDLTVAGSSTISVNETVTGDFSVEGDTSLGTNDGDTIDLGGGTSDRQQHVGLPVRSVARCGQHERPESRRLRLDRVGDERRRLRCRCRSLVAEQYDSDGSDDGPGRPGCRHHRSGC